MPYKRKEDRAAQMRRYRQHIKEQIGCYPSASVCLRLKEETERLKQRVKELEKKRIGVFF